MEKFKVGDRVWTRPNEISGTGKPDYRGIVKSVEEDGMCEVVFTWMHKDVTAGNVGKFYGRTVSPFDLNKMTKAEWDHGQLCEDEHYGRQATV